MLCIVQTLNEYSEPNHAKIFGKDKQSKGDKSEKREKKKGKNSVRLSQHA